LLPELIAFRDVIELARSPAEFIQRITKLLARDGPESVEARRAIARENTWDQRVTVMTEAIDRLLLAGNGGTPVRKRESVRVGLST
jgi:hypothetical protein